MPTTVYRNAEGNRIPSVTTVMDAVLAKPALIRWANRQGLMGIDIDAKKDALARVGTAAHELIVADLEERAPNVEEFSPQELDLAYNGYFRFLEWRSQHTLEPVHCEQHLVSEIMQTGGTPDFYGKVDGTLEIMDFKTSGAIYDEHTIQASTYLIMAQENNLDPQRIRILQIPRNEGEQFTELVLEDPSDIELRIHVFQHLRAVYDLMARIRKGRAA